MCHKIVTLTRIVTPFWHHQNETIMSGDSLRVNHIQLEFKLNIIDFLLFKVKIFQKLDFWQFLPKRSFINFNICVLT